MGTFISKNPSETHALGKRWGESLPSGCVLALQGDLGAGKTALVRGIAEGLHVPERVKSPTFALLHKYEGGRLPLFHLDLYRLNSRRDVVGAGLDEFLFHPPGITVVEWPERWLEPPPNDAAPPEWLWVKVSATAENVREFRYEGLADRI